jgi:hypothetical protein
MTESTPEDETTEPGRSEPGNPAISFATLVAVNEQLLRGYREMNAGLRAREATLKRLDDNLRIITEEVRAWRERLEQLHAEWRRDHEARLGWLDRQMPS